MKERPEIPVGRKPEEQEKRSFLHSEQYLRDGTNGEEYNKQEYYKRMNDLNRKCRGMKKEEGRKMAERLNDTNIEKINGGTRGDRDIYGVHCKYCGHFGMYLVEQRQEGSGIDTVFYTIYECPNCGCITILKFDKNDL